MKNNDYAWNEFEKKSYLNGEIKIPSKYKIKIDDDLEKRIEFELILENYHNIIYHIGRLQMLKDILMI